ncbi:permease [Desulfoferrobacter suflitae]|uniref:permease n=1 Tax=Desulfoferrobacter suflitae TaxID=2865782 RepID=UPI0021640291|nr:permease [Desulfoferrobacter suflitae]MCK8603740.1 permease [Desulfoferrobacter suflitae]
MNTFIATLEYFIIITAELTVLFLGISAIVALALMYIPQEKLKAWLSRRGILGNLLGAAVGALTPFCACSTIPMTLGMLNAGAPFGPVMSFVIASPLLNPIILTMIATLMGLKASLTYFAITFLGSVVFGVLLEKTGSARYVKNVRLKSSCCGATIEAVPAAFSIKVKVAARAAWGDFRAVLIYLLIGVGIGAGIYGYIPQEFVAQLAGPQNPFAIPVAAVIGVPLYIRAETAIPIGLALSQKGMSMGAVIALIIGGAGMAIPEMAMLMSIFRKQLVASIVAVIWATAVIGGYVFNVIG